MGYAQASTELICQQLEIRGQVQGVGFRPYVYQLARLLHLTGQVRNDASGVQITVQGPTSSVAEFRECLTTQLPPLARIDEITEKTRVIDPSVQHFTIADSDAEGAACAQITPDAAQCSQCRAEMFDPADRRYRYPFINCTHCGPRYTITSAVPYDRPNTSMAQFRMCPDCKSEYEEPADRRFHAQPNACPVCGPKLGLVDANGKRIDCDDVVAEVWRRLAAGEIVALKGLGGFHLVCDARNPDAVAKLRERKDRDSKPFAVMVSNSASLAELAVCDLESVALLESVEAPIVLLPKAEKCDAALVGIAPDVAWLGVMLPYTPLQHLLFHEAAGRPDADTMASSVLPTALVMTSANPRGEPLVIGNRDAQRRLKKIADAVVVHNRDILLRCDDSVVRRAGGRTSFIRRARGFTPQPIQLPHGGPSVLAVGAWFKNTICITRDDQAYVSAHIGDLDNAAACQSLEETVQHMLDVLQIEPHMVVHDLHPDFFSTRYAEWFASEHKLPQIGVQHHHAHLAAVMADQQLTGRTLGVSLDGLGMGADGELWGGELLGCDGAGFLRMGHLRPLALPGGDRASREPWRLAAAVLHEIGSGAEIEKRFAHLEAAPTVRQMLQKDLNSPATSSAGRLFDAAAGILGVKEVCHYEAEAAMVLESLAERHGPVSALSHGYLINEENQLDFLPLLATMFEIDDPGYGAALFHATLSEGLSKWAIAGAAAQEVDRVLFGGGCFLNRMLTTQLRTALEASGLQVFEPQQVPPNDGSISLGQAWIIIARSRYEQ